ncbi:unnamed protein product, partial [marine sediment metagenome]
SAIILLATGALARKREDNKVLGIAMVVAAILGLIGVLVPLADPNISMIISITGGLSMGFYLPLLGAIIGIGAGAVAVEIKRTIVAEVSQPDVRIVEEKFPSEKAKFEFCPECGSKIEEPEIKVCGKCGFVLKPPELAPL